MDDREPTEFQELLAESCPIPIKVKRLKTGDMVCGNTAIERKTINDLAGSIIDKRIFKQAKRLHKKYKHVMIIISGRIEDLKSQINPNSIWGVMSYLASKKISVITVDSETELIYVALRFFKHCGEINLK